MRIFSFLILLLSFASLRAQEGLTYQKPSQEILDLVDVSLAPSVLMDESKNYMILISRDMYGSIEELSQEELRLGGLRIDPKTNIGSRVNYYNNLQVKNLKEKKAKILQVKNLPDHPKLTNFKWSPNQGKLAFTNTTENGVEVWVMDLATASAKKITKDNINANIGDVINWFNDGNSLLVKVVSENKQALMNTESAVPTGPTISVNDGKIGRASCRERV